VKAWRIEQDSFGNLVLPWFPRYTQAGNWASGLVNLNACASYKGNTGGLLKEI
jgi:hypothetical protein